MNNFIVGQVTPDMLVHLKYGTFIFFGLLIFIGAAFIWFFVPETKQLTLEEMDAVFGASGVAAADRVLMEEIAKEVGLDEMAHTGRRPSRDSSDAFDKAEKLTSVRADEKDNDS